MSGEKRSLPIPDPETIEYWKACKDHKLIIQKCAHCHKFRFYPQNICPFCQSNQFKWVEATGRGHIFSFSVVYRAADKAFANHAPYILALVELDERVRMKSQIIEANPDNLKIGQRVEVVFKDLTEEITLPFFKPIGAG
jgi:hypothetical protein